jgi:hypothetical protein
MPGSTTLSLSLQPIHGFWIPAFPAGMTAARCDVIPEWIAGRFYSGAGIQTAGVQV